MYGDDVLSLTVSSSNFSHNGHLRLTPEELEDYDGLPFGYAGGGIAAEGYTAAVNVSVHGCSFVDNVAESGGGVGVTQWGYARGYLEVQDCYFQRNQVGLVSRGATGLMAFHSVLTIWLELVMKACRAATAVLGLHTIVLGLYKICCPVAVQASSQPCITNSGSQLSLQTTAFSQCIAEQA